MHILEQSYRYRTPAKWVVVSAQLLRKAKYGVVEVLRVSDPTLRRMLESIRRLPRSMMLTKDACGVSGAGDVVRLLPNVVIAVLDVVNDYRPVSDKEGSLWQRSELGVHDTKCIYRRQGRTSEWQRAEGVYHRQVGLSGLDTTSWVYLSSTRRTEWSDTTSWAA